MTKTIDIVEHKKNNIHYLCPLCGSNELESIFLKELKFLDISYGNTLCLECGFFFRVPILNYNELSSMYKDKNKMLSSTQYVNRNKNSAVYQIRAGTFRFLQQNIPMEIGGNVLDIGCNDGFFLEGFKNKHWNLFGVDQGVNTEYVKNKNIIFISAPIEDFDTNKKFDLITILNTLEHISNPRLVIKKTYSLLRDSDGGYLLVDVPNSLKPAIKISEFYSIEHISNFTKDTVKYLLLSEGFEIIATEFKGASIKVICKKASLASPRNNKDYKFLNSTADKLKNVLSNYRYVKKDFEMSIINKINNIDFEKYSGKIGIFGAGWHTLQLYSLINFNKHVKYYFDSDKRKQGTHFLNKLVLSPTQIPKTDIEVVIISSGDYQDEMYDSIKKFEQVKIIKLYPENKYT